MAKAADNEIMSPAEMKPLLMLSKRQPVNCAIGLTKDKEGVILLDKKAKPRKLIAMIKSEAKSKKIDLDMSSLRFGRAEVDTEVNAALVQFIVNKEVAGTLRPKLLESLKKAGFQKCEITVDTKLDESEDEDDKQDEQAAAPVAQADAGDAPAASAAPAAGEPAAAAPAAEAPDPAAPAATDVGPVTKRLTDLVKRMLAGMAGNPAGGDAMKTAATAAQAAIQAGKVEEATAEADTLERLLDAAEQAGAGGGAAGGKAAGPAIGSPVIAKAGATWVATRKKIESEIEKLHDELQSVYKGQGVVADLEKTFRAKVEPMMSTLDSSLSDKLADMSKNADPAAHAKMIDEVTKIIENYKSFLSSDPLIAKLDSNPFVPLAIEKTLTASLNALEKVLA